MVVIGIRLHVSGGGMVESLVLLGVEKGGHGGRRWFKDDRDNTGVGGEE